ncbi:hypothetical protein V1477_005744 [Vespula maculifrons]|uniref:Uncharacterized protein n=1 Tax=Vespula maculifrons TaxID=7453 RepID=A0ABD2CLW5_VESMC
MRLQVIPSVVVELRYTKPTEDESSTKRLDVLRRSRIHLYLNFKFQRRYNKFNNAPPDNITLHIQNYMQSKKVFLFIIEFITNIPNGMKPKLEHHVSLLQLTDKPAFQLVSAKKINQHVGLVNRQYHRKSKHGRYRVRWVKNPKRCAGYKYRRSEDGDEAAGHSFGDCRTSNTRASVVQQIFLRAYFIRSRDQDTLNQPRTKAVPRAWMYYKGAEFTYTGILNSEEDTKSSTTLHQII